MGLITNLQIILLLICNILETSSIITPFHYHHSRRYIDPAISDWEIGLREATYNALLRERQIKHPHLREYLYNAPLLGRQDTATPFGDIAIVARGQLYSAPGGFQFVQDPYQNDCEGCHNTPLQCDRHPCEYWAPQAHERLLALWTIKRIRHRDSQYGFKYDFEYKVSPMSSIRDKPFIRRNGNYDYSIPGYKFVIQKTSTFENSNAYPTKPYYSFSPYDTTRQYPHNKEPNHNEYLPPILPPITEEYYDEDPRNRPYGPNGYKDVFYEPTVPTIATPADYTTATTNNNDHDLYNNAIGTLTTKQVSSSNTEKSQEADFLFPKHEQTSYTERHFLPTDPNYKTTPIKSTIQLPLLTTSPTTTKTTYFSESTRFVQYSEPDPLYSTTTSTTPATTSISFATKNQQTPSSTTSLAANYYSSHRSTTTRFPSVYDYMGIGEHAITVVTAPNMSPQSNLSSTESPHLDQQNDEKETTTATLGTHKTEKSTQKIISTQPTKLTNRDPSTPITTDSTTQEVKETMSTNSVNKLQTNPTTSTFRYITYKSVGKKEPQSTTSPINTETTTSTTMSLTKTQTHKESITPSSEYTLHPTTIPIPILYITTKHPDKDEKDLNDKEFEDEIFGKPYTAPRVMMITKKPKTTLATDLEDIFGTHFDYFEAYDYENPPTQPALPKIIFSNFYLAPTEPTEITQETTTEEVTTPMKNYDIQNKTSIPITSQSYITSVSFKVNKKSDNSSNLNDDDVSQLTTTEDRFMVDETTTEPISTLESNKVLDRLTMSVLTNAKSIKYLSRKNSSSPYKYYQKKDMRPVQLPKRDSNLEANKGNHS